MADNPPVDPQVDPSAAAGSAPPGSGATGRRPSPAAAAASRARRIGGATHRGLPAPPPEPPRGTRPSVPGADDRTTGSAATTATDRSSAPAATANLTKPRPRVTADTEHAGEPDLDASPVDGVSNPSGKPAVPAWLNWAPAAVLVAGVIAMAVVLALVSHGVWWGDRGSSARASDALREKVTAAAKTCLAATNTYKYTDIDAFEQAGTACTTGAQTTQFRKAVDSLIRKNAPKLKFTQTAQINKAAIESVEDGQWTLLMFGQLQVTNVNTPSGRTDPFAALVRMQQVKGKWVISSLRTVSSPVDR